MAVEKDIDELLERLLEGRKPEEVGERGPMSGLMSRLMERALEVEFTDHLRYEKHAPGVTAGVGRG